MSDRATPVKVLLIEDEEITREWTQRLLEQAGFRVLAAADAASARRVAASFDPHVAVLDLMLPDAEDFSLTRDFAERFGCGVIIVSSSRARQRRIDGLRCGADDFLHKPFDPDELVIKVARLAERVRSAARGRGQQDGGCGVEGSAPRCYRCGPWLLRPAGLLCIHDEGREVSLTHKEARLLRQLLDHPGRLFTRAELRAGLEGPGEPASDRSVDSCISRLRKKLEQNPGRPMWLQSVYGRGYRFSSRAFPEEANPQGERDD